jgi:glycosyltransferase involved in cell wall biosynthesis
LWVLKNADAIVVPGAKSKEFYLSIPQIKRDRIFVVPNVSILPPVNEAIYRKIDDIRETLKLKGKKIILYVGRLTKTKGFNYLLVAFLKIHAIYPDTALIVVGGKYGNTQKYGSVDFSFDLNVLEKNSVYFVGWKCNPEKAAYFLLADLVVVPSIFDGDRCEVWGFAVNEAMFAGKPVIATKAVGAAYDLIQDGINGYVIPDKDPNALLEAIRTIIEDPVKQNSMGIKSLQIIQNGFTYEKMFFGFVEAINHALIALQKKRH